MPEEKKPIFPQKSEVDKVQADRHEFLAREFANITPEFMEYGKMKLLAKKHHFMIKDDEIIYLSDDKIAVNEVYKSEEPNMQITITALLEEKFVFDPFGTDKLQLVCNKAKFK
jgi:hypothetical protein